MKPRSYMDACCLIEAVKGRLGRTSTHDPEQVDMIHRLLRASRAGEIDVYTSMLSVAEVLYVDKDERPPGVETRDIIDRLLFSGRDGVKLVGTSPSIAKRARDLAWGSDIYTRSIDLLHVASALECRSTELITLDGRLAKKLNRTEVSGVRLIDPIQTANLPDEYRTDDLFKEQ